MSDSSLNGDAGGKLFGKYRGTVLQNVDPLQQGRIQVMLPGLSDFIPSSWAMPAVPLAGIQMGIYVVPPVQSGVWVEFEGGDPDYPIWSGSWWGSAAEVPALALAGLPNSPNIVLQTQGQNAVVVSDVPGPSGGIMLKSATGAMILVNDTGITISNGKGATIVMAGPTVTINNGALAIT